MVLHTVSLTINGFFSTIPFTVDFIASHSYLTSRFLV